MKYKFPSICTFKINRIKEMEEDFPYDDAHFEAKKAQIEVKEPKDLVCESNNKIARICTKHSCTFISLLCDKKECLTCKSEEHKKCPIVSLDGVTDNLNQHIPTKKYILEQVGIVESKLFKSLQEASNKLIKDIRFAGIGEKERKIIEEIYDKNNVKCLKGGEAA